MSHEINMAKNPYEIDIRVLGDLIDPKNTKLLHDLGGIDGLLSKLKVNKSTGLLEQSEEEKLLIDIDKYGPYSELLRERHQPFDKRRFWFGINIVPIPPSKTFIAIVLESFSDPMLRLLFVIAVISTIIGVLLQYHAIPSTSNHDGAWAEGVAIFIAVIAVVSVSSINNYRKELQFRTLSTKKEERNIKVFRNSTTKVIDSKEVVVGDIIELEPGNLVVVDGVFISGYDLKCDESAATGESDLISKSPLKDMFLISGSKVAEGVGKYLVTNVGINSFHGKSMMGLQVEEKKTPLEAKLRKLTKVITRLALSIAIILFLSLLVKVLITEAMRGQFKDSADITISIIEVFITTVTIVVVAIPEGLPLAVTLALSSASRRMIKDNNFVRVLSACEVMGHCTTICSDKTGTLTQNEMTVVCGTIGTTEWINQSDDKLPEEIIPATWSILHDNIAINSSAFLSNGEFVGSKTETSLLLWQLKYKISFEDFRKEADIVQLFPFSSESKIMITVVKLTVSEKIIYRALMKGASEIVISYCHDSNPQITLDICGYAELALRTIGLAYRDFTEESYQSLTASGVELKSVLSDYVLLGIFGIEDPVRDGVLDAVKNCQHAGVIVRMVTGDNIATAKAIAKKCGIYLHGGIAMQGHEFRNLSDKEMDRIVPKLQVLARSSPLDKRLLVEKLRKLGEVVAVTGDGTNDGAALKAADVGFSMGICGTEVAKEASSIILLDDNFTSIVKALIWGRCVNDAVKRFCSFS